MKKCPNCNNQVVDEALFCTKCGTKLEEVVERPVESEEKNEIQDKMEELAEVEETIETEAPKEEKQQTKKKGNRLGIVFGVLFLIAVCIIIGVVLLNKDNEGKEIASDNVQPKEQVTTQTITTETVTTQTTTTEAITQATTQEIAPEVTEEITAVENNASSEGYIEDDNMLMSFPGIVGYDYYLGFSYYSSDFDWGDIVWENKNPEIVDFETNSSYIEFLAEGTATILATYEGKTYQSTVVVGPKDPNQYPVRIESDINELNLSLNGDITKENPLQINYKISGDYPDTAHVIVREPECFSDSIYTARASIPTNHEYSIEIYPNERNNQTSIVTILWDPVTKKIYGINMIPTKVE